jgi:uncharacterized Ntn-hydrolase superfamily protein
MRSTLLITGLFLQSCFCLKAQDTFSILGMDTVTGEIGAAGASCVDLFANPFFSNDFITELFPDTGAIACQASYLQGNQANARARMRAGDNPAQLMSWLVANDVQGNPHLRQYGALRRSGSAVQTAAYTGTNCMNYKNHIVGPGYTIHGNILQGQHILDSMEAGFKRATGGLACKLMAALQGARVVGADTRCSSNGSSSLFAFIKVTQPSDTFGKPSFILSLKTHANAGIEPIDSLQKLFDAVKSCTVNTAGLPAYALNGEPVIFPNPAFRVVHIRGGNTLIKCQVYDVAGREVYRTSFTGLLSIPVEQWGKGLYFIQLESGQGRLTRKLIID